MRRTNALATAVEGPGGKSGSTDVSQTNTPLSFNLLIPASLTPRALFLNPNPPRCIDSSFNKYSLGLGIRSIPLFAKAARNLLTIGLVLLRILCRVSISKLPGKKIIAIPMCRNRSVVKLGNNDRKELKAAGKVLKTRELISCVGKYNWAIPICFLCLETENIKS